MNFLKLNKNQCIELVPRCKCSVSVAIYEEITFIKENELESVDLIFDGFCMGIYPGDFKNAESKFVHELELEFNNWKELNIKLPTEPG